MKIPHRSFSDKICRRAKTTDLVYEKARLRRREHAIIIKTCRRLAVDLHTSDSRREHAGVHGSSGF